jgi:hypothetical protein
METAFYVGAGMLAVGFLLTQFLLPGGKQQDIESPPALTLAAAAHRVA